MKFNFKKIASVIASAVMLSSTAGIALAATYPAPMVVGGTGDGAIIVTSGSHAGAVSDWDAAVGLQTSLQGSVTSTTTSTGGSSSGEAYPLWTSGTKIYINDSLNKVKSILTENELPIILADTSFSGDVDSTVTQTMTFNSFPQVTFAKMPTGDEDPAVGLLLYTTKGKDVYNLTITFDKAVAFNNTDSEKQSITMFGQKFTVGTATDGTNLILYKSSDTFDLSVGGANPNPSQVVTVEGKEYTVELTAATDTAGTVRVTKSDGTADTKEISEGASKKIGDLEVAVNLADESTATSSISAEVTVGAQKVKLTEASEVKIGSDEDSVDNTNVNFAGGGSPSNLTKLVIQVAALDSDSDGIIPGGAFIDPVFGTFKIDFAGLNIDEKSSARETIEVKSTADTGTLKMTAYNAAEKTITWYNNKSGAAVLADSSRNYISVRESATVNKSEYVVVGNEDEGGLMKVKTIYNETDATKYTSDEVKLEDVFTGKEYSASMTAEGAGTITILGKQYTLNYIADKSVDSANSYIMLDYPDSSTAGNKVLFPTIQTSKGALIAFYEPQVINLSDFKENGGNTQNVTGLMFPDGDGYETTLTVAPANGHPDLWNLTVGGVIYALNTSGVAATGITGIGLNVSYGISDGNTAAFKWNITGAGAAKMGNVNITLIDNAGATINRPAIMVFEEKDDNNDRMGFIIQTEGSGTSTDEDGVSDIDWAASAVLASKQLSDFSQLESDDDLYKWVDLWGTIATVDKATTSQYTATISYPDEQVYAQIYAAELAAAITVGATTGGAGGQILVVKDSDVNSVKDKNLVVVGGSCVNSVAANVLGVTYPTCGADFTAKTSVGAGQYLVKAIASPYNAAKTAVLVAGYEAADTKNAVGKLKESHVTDVGTSKVYPQAAA